VQTLLITPGSPWKNGSIEGINERLRHERLDQEQLDILLEVTVVMERWRHIDNGIRPHSTLMVSCAGAIAQAAIRLTHMATGTTTGARSVLAILPAKLRIKPLQNTEHIQGPHRCPQPHRLKHEVVRPDFIVSTASCTVPNGLLPP
jgi:hypothetical protein